MRHRPAFACAAVLAMVIGTTCREAAAPGRVQPTSAVKLAFLVQPTAVPEGLRLTPAIEIATEDSSGNVVADTTDTVTLAITAWTGRPGASLLGTVMRRAAAGLASFTDLVIDSVGTGYTLTASAPRLAPATSTPFSVTHRAVASVSVTPSTATLLALGASIQFTAQARDSANRPITARTFAWTSSDTSVVAISGPGFITAMDSGAATVTAVSESVAGKATITVIPMAATASAVSAGGQYTCGISTVGAAYCWGVNDFGQLGTGSRAAVNRPAPVAGGLTFRQVSAGNRHTCAVTAGGQAYCWGDDYAGQLGASASSTCQSSFILPFPCSQLPVAVSQGDLSFVSVTAGGRAEECYSLRSGISCDGGMFTCGLTTSGAAYCWGDNEYGQLGTGQQGGAANEPRAVAGGLLFTSLSAGKTHVCGVTTAGAAYCWGLGWSGALGSPVYVPASSPAPVSGGLRFQSVSAGGDFSCGVTTDAAAYCWGTIGSNPSAPANPNPLPVSGGLSFQVVTAGLSHACGLTTDGEAYCWGSNLDHQLGDSTTAEQCQNVAYGHTFSWPCSSSPVLVAGGYRFRSLSAGSTHTCGVTTSGATYCWGDNRAGELGNGATTGSASLTPSTVSGNLAYQSVGAGDAHTCGVSGSGSLYCWGDDSHGQLGTTAALESCGNSGYADHCSFVPLAVAGGLSFQNVSSGFRASCALTPSGSAFCWGDNSAGQLGTGDTVARTTPTPISGGLTFRTLSMGIASTCGIAADSSAYCWGWNYYGRLGTGDTTNRLVPTRVVGGLKFRAISVGTGTCGINSDGAAYCWGENWVGEFGNGTTSSGSVTPVPVLSGLRFRSLSTADGGVCGVTTSGDAYCWGQGYGGATPGLVPGGLTFQSLGMGDGHACGLTTNGAAYCWGPNNGLGEFGNGTTTFGTIPTAVSGGHTFAALTLGSRHACGITASGAAYCWGDNSTGQVGTPTWIADPTPVAGSVVFQTSPSRSATVRRPRHTRAP